MAVALSVILVFVVALIVALVGAGALQSLPRN